MNFLRQDAEVTETLDHTLQQLYALAGQTG